MTDIRFGRLQNLGVRVVWPHEASAFTPWLAENIEHLSETIGIPLELTGTEVAVDSFSADILARNPMDDSLVLIENQLEATDHTHLGQIMTYLAGLEAQTVVWIAPRFRQPHLSAIRWLNEHTSDGFSFFAVKLRVVQIEDSPYAPIFEIVAEPDSWVRHNTAKKKAAKSTDPLSDTRKEFWTRYLDRYPEAEADGLRVIRGWNCYCPFADGRGRVSVWIGEKAAGIYIGGGHGDRFGALDVLGPRGVRNIANAIGVQAFDQNSDTGHVLGERLEKTYADTSNWTEIIDWMEERRLVYLNAIQEVLERGK